ncbi:uncharacterized protein LOC130114543 [Lampris incognitus]|uniref:uncharacterized protein LOC130114543 n=1 Tax=Lampris incognitus TaxID=2546036 RepID=UPI0024B5C4CF|nr:uncharacterized protein LOC130114543 [Lampris incognitus]
MPPKDKLSDATYPRKAEAEEGIAETIQGLLASGVLEPSTSAWNTPILPVEKPGTGTYRMAHDLRSINNVLLTPTIPVPNPYTALNALDPRQKWFTCIYLANAFFCLPLADHLRDVFSFTFRGRQSRYTRVPQRFANSPGLFSQVLKDILSDCPFPPDCTLVQYVDDLLLAAPSPSSCALATDQVLRHLSTTGFKVSKTKLQAIRTQVSFLGRVISQKGAAISAAHRTNILCHPKPLKVKDMLSFLGLTGYSRHYIPNYVGLMTHLHHMVRTCGMRNLNAHLPWSMEAEHCFTELKQLLAQSAELAIPDHTRPFFLDVSETEGVVNGILFQKKGGERKVLTYASIMLDAMEKRHPPCTQHAAGIAKMLLKTAHIVMGHPLTVLTTHSVVAYVNSQRFTMTPTAAATNNQGARSPECHVYTEGINMADRMGTGEPHECVRRIEQEEKVRPDLEAQAIPGTETLYTDGCCYRNEETGFHAGYAVVRQTEEGFETVIAKRMEGQLSAQRAEIKALIAALEWSRGKEVTIYSDSAYAVGAVHIEIPQWKRVGFLMAGGKPIRHEQEMKELLEAIQLPQKVAIVKCKGHDPTNTPVAKGNQEADQVAKQVTGYRVSYQLIVYEDEVLRAKWDHETMKYFQGEAGIHEKAEIVLDYTDMGESRKVKGYQYLLICVDQLTGWPEAWPAKKEDSAMVIKCLINYYIPRHGFPAKIRTDNGTHFKNSDLQKVEAMLGLKHAFGTVYHPQSQGKVERMNQNLKQKLARICAQTKMNWVDVLPLALMTIRSSVNQGTGFTPYELMTGRQFPGPGAAPQDEMGNRGMSAGKCFKELQALVSEFSQQVGEKQALPTGTTLPTAKWVLLRVIKRKWSEPRWTGPYEVTERTSHAVRLKGKGTTRYHWSQCAAAKEPGRTLQDIQDNLQEASTSSGELEGSLTLPEADTVSRSQGESAGNLSPRS